MIYRNFIAGVLSFGCCLLTGAFIAQNSFAADDVPAASTTIDASDILIIEEEGEGDVQALEEQVERILDDMDDLRGKFGTLSRNVNVTGYGEVHLNVPTSEDGDAKFDAHRFVLGVNARLADWVFLNAEIDYEHAAQELEFEMGYLDFLIDPKFNVRTGVVLVPIGFLNEFHEPVFFWTVERPDLQSRLIPTSWNGTGGGFFGTFGNFLGGMNYRFYVIEGLDSGGLAGASGFQASTGIRSGRRLPDEIIANDIAVTGRVEFTNLFPGFQLGGSFYTGNTTHAKAPFNARTTILETDIKYRKKWFDMNATLVNIHVNNAAELQTVSGRNTASNMFGYNVQVGVHVPQLLHIATTQDLVVHFMYEFIDTQNDVPFNVVKQIQHERDVFTFGLAWFASPKVALKWDFQHREFGDNTSSDTMNFGMAYMYY